jgi:pyruvate-formate lyase
LQEQFTAGREGKYQEVAYIPFFSSLCLMQNWNADPYADEQMKWICDTYYEICGECYSTRAGRFKSGLYSASDHVFQGYHTWATPDGRKTGEPLADATSPAQGRDCNGPTAVFNSARCYDHSKFMDGLALNIRIHPSALSREDGIAKLRDLTKAYLNSGGMEVQYNIVSSATMRVAQEDPDSYRNLVVRIAGYSAYFVELRGCAKIISHSGASAGWADARRRDAGDVVHRRGAATQQMPSRRRAP